MRTIGKSFLLTMLIAAGSVALYVYHDRTTAQYKIEQLQQQVEEKEQAIQRLETHYRKARIVVTDQSTVDGQLHTTFLFVEYRADGSELPAKQFTIVGNEVHFDAEVIKFNDEYVKAGDPLRGHSIMLFTRVYGAHQAPADGFAIDEPGHIPQIYRGADPKVSDFEQGLWKNFWDLYNNQAARQTLGISGLHGEGLFGQFDKNHVYTITVRADGGGDIQEAPMDSLYQQAMQRP
jgi:hypothetical protein